MKLVLQASDLLLAPKTHAHKHILEAPHAALADSGKEGGRSMWSHNLLPPDHNVAGRHQ